MDQSGVRCVRVKHSKIAARHVSILLYKHGQEPIRLHKLSQVFKNYYYLPAFKTVSSNKTYINTKL